MSSVNKVIIVGNVGNDPEIRTMQSGDKVCSFSVATSESWKDKNTGEKRESTQWHNVVIFQKGLVGVCEKYLKKGSKVYVEGMLQTRSWEDQGGVKKYTTEVVLKNYVGSMTMLSSSQQGNNQSTQQISDQMQEPLDELEDEIPF